MINDNNNNALIMEELFKTMQCRSPMATGWQLSTTQQWQTTSSRNTVRMIVMAVMIIMMIMILIVMVVSNNLKQKYGKHNCDDSLDCTDFHHDNLDDNDLNHDGCVQQSQAGIW